MVQFNWKFNRLILLTISRLIRYVNLGFDGFFFRVANGFFFASTECRFRRQRLGRERLQFRCHWNEAMTVVLTVLAVMMVVVMLALVMMDLYFEFKVPDDQRF